MPASSSFVRALRCAVATVALTALLGGCGGSSKVEDYVPLRIVSFGDDLSAIVAGSGTDARKYSINAFASGSTTVVDCTVAPTWNQGLATNFGMAYAACPLAGAALNATLLAARNATVDAIEAQVGSVAPATLVPSTLVTIQGGMWDVIAAYNAVKAGGDLSAAITLMGQKGAQLANVVNRITNDGAGARVIYGTVPDLGCTPLAVTDGVAVADVCADQGRRGDVLTELTRTFNESFRTGFARLPGTNTSVQYGQGVVNDGRYAGLVAFDDVIRAMANRSFRSAVYGLVNTDAAVQVAACVPSATTDDISACTTATLVAEASGNAFAYLWASDVLPGPAWHTRVANVAITRARNNPF